MDITRIIIIAIIVFCVAVLLIWEICKKGLRKTAIELIVQAEKTMQDNEDKFKLAVNGMITKLPFPLNIFITESMVAGFIQKTFDEVKIALDYREEEE